MLTEVLALISTWDSEIFSVVPSLITKQLTLPGTWHFVFNVIPSYFHISSLDISDYKCTGGGVRYGHILSFKYFRLEHKCERIIAVKCLRLELLNLKDRSPKFYSLLCFFTFLLLDLCMFLCCY